MKTCTRCNETKNLADFYNHKNTKDKKTSQCKACFKIHEQNWRINNPEKYKESCRKRNLQRDYGITQDDYIVMYKKQEGKCACCGKEQKTLVVDHNHTTNAIRELLCPQCNTALGLLKEDINIMQSLIEYTRKHNG